MFSSDLYSNFIPTVTEKTAKGTHVYDLPSRLFKDRIVILNGPIDGQVATLICSQLLVLQHENPESDIQMLINSPGGDVTAGFAIYDMMQVLSCKVSTVAIGMAASAASLILAGGTKGMRYILPNSQVLLHQPWGGVKGQVTDMDIHLQNMKRMKETGINILHKHTGQPVEKLAADTERDFILMSDEAVEYGVVDKILDFKSSE